MNKRPIRAFFILSSVIINKSSRIVLIPKADIKIIISGIRKRNLQPKGKKRTVIILNKV